MPDDTATQTKDILSESLEEFYERINKPDFDKVHLQPLSHFKVSPKPDPNELISDRFLCRGGGLMVVGCTEAGKSTFVFQMSICFALGKDFCGFKPFKPLKIAYIQAENDDGDIGEMIPGILDKMNLSQEEINQVEANFDVVTETRWSGSQFFEITLWKVFKEFKPDLLIIDPVLSYLGGDANSQQTVSDFLRLNLNLYLRRKKCGCVLVHHTGKFPSNSRQKSLDPVYLSLGSSEWSNWARAVLVFHKTAIPGVFRLEAAKRGRRLGWVAADGVTPCTDKYLAHSKEPGVICWRELTPEEAHKVQKSKTSRKETVTDAMVEAVILTHVPQDKRISKNDLIDQANKSGIGEKRVKECLKAMIAAGKLQEHDRPRVGTNPEKLISMRSQKTETAA